MAYNPSTREVETVDLYDSMAIHPNQLDGHQTSVRETLPQVKRWMVPEE